MRFVIPFDNAMMLECFYSEIFLKNCHGQLQAKSTLHSNGECMIWKGAVNNRGYGIFRYRAPEGTFRSIGAHRVSAFVNNGLDGNFDFVLSERLHASHLCHNKKCINPSHINLESSSINQLRQNCIRTNACHGHCTRDGRRQPDCLLHLMAIHEPGH